VPTSPAIDRQELEALYRKYGPLVRRRARGILGDDAEAQDALQEVFVRVIRAMGEFRRQSQPSTWLYRITTNLCLNRIRDSRRRRDHLERLGEDERVHSRPAQPQEARVILQRLLPGLDDELAEIAVYYYVDEMDQVEISRLLGVSRRTIGYRLERFRALAQERLEGVPTVAASAAPRGPKPEEEPGP
jgi:RNA polymerase sigma-70 factor (ECF subfamily)